MIHNDIFAPTNLTSKVTFTFLEYLSRYFEGWKSVKYGVGSCVTPSVL